MVSWATQHLPAFLCTCVCVHVCMCAYVCVFVYVNAFAEADEISRNITRMGHVSNERVLPVMN